MSSVIPTKRVLSLPCFEALRIYRHYASLYPHLSNNDLLSLIYNVEADAKSLDMEASVYLSTLVEAECPLDGKVFYQTCIKAVLTKHQPSWAKVMQQGRLRFIKNLNLNDKDVFSAAGLLEFPVSFEVATWWDKVSNISRLYSNQEKIQQGRKAEYLTIEHERNRLRKIGIEKEPEWPGLDNNFAGYDVLSYDLGSQNTITSKLIEVKSTIISPLRFIITRNEWNKALQAGSKYIFHIWDMHPANPILKIRKVDDIKLHIPNDKGKGEWRNAVIPVV